MIESLPISLMYNLNRLGQAGDEIDVSPTADERATIARFVDILAVERFTAKIRLTKAGSNRFTADYRFDAGIVQACVVSLEPVAARIAQDFSRDLLFSPPLRRAKGAEIPEEMLAPAEDDAPEMIDNLQYDLAGPLMEEFVLAIDPYPRASGVEFTAPEIASDKPENPFAVLKGLKSDG